VRHAFHFSLDIISIIALLFTVLFIIAYIELLRRKKWARKLLLVLSGFFMFTIIISIFQLYMIAPSNSIHIPAELTPTIEAAKKRWTSPLFLLSQAYIVLYYCLFIPSEQPPARNIIQQVTAITPIDLLCGELVKTFFSIIPP